MALHGGFELQDFQSQMATTLQTATWTFTVIARILTILASMMAIVDTTQICTTVREWGMLAPAVSCLSTQTWTSTAVRPIRVRFSKWTTNLPFITTRADQFRRLAEVVVQVVAVLLSQV
jgi:hypothetical protein